MLVSIEVQIATHITTQLIEELISLFPADEDNPHWGLDSAQQFVNDKNILILGYCDGKLAGFVYGYQSPRPDTKKEFLVYEVAVHEEFQRRGVAIAMLEKLKQYLHENNFSEAWVLTNPSNAAALNLYAKAGAIANPDPVVMYEWFKL